MNNSSTVCFELSPEEIETFEIYRWWIDDIVERIIGSAGIVANLIAIFILTRNNMKSNFNLLLTFLAVCDSLFIFFGLFEGVESNLNSKIKFDNWLNLVWYPFYHMTMTASIYMTICLSFERYRALIMNPAKFHSSLTHQSRRKVFIWAFSILGFAFTFNVPKFFEFKFTPDDYLVLSELYNDYYFVLFYDNIARNLVLVVIPFTSLGFFNLRIFLKLRKRRDFITKKQQSERQTYIILFGVVVILFTCHLLRIFTVIRLLVNVASPTVQESVQNDCPDFESLWVHILRLFSNLMLTINSSINFFVYYYSNKTFRNVLLKTCCCCCSQNLERDFATSSARSPNQGMTSGRLETSSTNINTTRIVEQEFSDTAL